MQFIFFITNAIIISLVLSKVSAQTKAVAVLTGNMNGSPISGLVSFEQISNENLKIIVNLSGLPSGMGQFKHGIHVHAFGILDPSDNVTIRCGSSGSHFNPLGFTHGDINDAVRHVGDYGNVISDNNGKIFTVLSDKISKLTGAFGIIGRTVVLHQLEDDLGKGGNADSKLTGNSGARIACGVIGISS